MDHTVENYLDRLIDLEEILGMHASYRILDPFRWRTSTPNDFLSLQGAAKKIASFVGLANYKFIVSVVSQSKGTAAHIQLDRRGTEVFIEVDTNLLDHESAALATLAHEITHKYLHVHSIGIGLTEAENEYATDIAAVYLGLGKLLLNGRESRTQTVRRVPSGRKRTTTQLTVGYVDREHLALVYRTVCAMRKVDSRTREAGLNPEALNALRCCEREFLTYFEFGASNELDASIRKRVHAVREMLGDQEKALHQVANALEAVHAIFRRAHSGVNGVERALADAVGSGANPHLRYLKLAMVSCTAARLEAQIRAQEIYSGSIYRAARALARLPVSSPDGVVVTCPIDGTKLRVPQGKQRLLVTCPRDGYKFIVSTAATPGRRTLWTRILSALRPRVPGFGQRTQEVAFQPNGTMRQGAAPESSRSDGGAPETRYRQIWNELLGKLAGDQRALERLVRHAGQSHPDAEDYDCLLIVAEQLERDRR